MSDHLAKQSQPGDLLLIMSNGSFDGLCEKLVKKLAQTVPSGAHAE